MLWGLNPMTHCNIITCLSNIKSLEAQLSYRFICFIKKCLVHGNSVVRNVALLALSNPMSCAGNNYRQVVNKYENVLNNPSCVYNEFYCMCEDNIDDIAVLRDMIDVRDGFKTCELFTTDEVIDIINDICLD
jgi:hypothetical protein